MLWGASQGPRCLVWSIVWIEIFALVTPSRRITYQPRPSLRQIPCLKFVSSCLLLVHPHPQTIFYLINLINPTPSMASINSFCPAADAGIFAHHDPHVSNTTIDSNIYFRAGFALVVSTTMGAMLACAMLRTKKLLLLYLALTGAPVAFIWPFIPWREVAVFHRYMSSLTDDLAPILDSISFIGFLSATGYRFWKSRPVVCLPRRRIFSLGACAIPSISAAQTTLESSPLAFLARSFSGNPSLDEHRDTQDEQNTPGDREPEATPTTDVSPEVVLNTAPVAQSATVAENFQAELLVARVAIYQKDAKIKELTDELVNLQMALAGREIELEETISGRGDREETLQRLYTAAARFFDRKLQTTAQTDANVSESSFQTHTQIFADYVTKMAGRYADAIETSNKAYTELHGSYEKYRADSAAKLTRKEQDYASRLRQKDAETQILVHGLKVKLERSREQARLAIHLAGRYRDEVTKRDRQLSQLRRLTTPHAGEREGGAGGNGMLPLYNESPVHTSHKVTHGSPDRSGSVLLLLPSVLDSESPEESKS
ncbi:hypothetical protein C8Q78DRAFT_101993 [Trametes maxima]|nr:hypothetical protein C8Q78DRAFT_101993 [Trametes maxima]